MRRFLLSVSKTNVGPVFRESLPIAGRDGTLAGRLETVTDTRLCQDRLSDLRQLAFRIPHHFQGATFHLFDHVQRPNRVSQQHPPNQTRLLPYLRLIHTFLPKKSKIRVKFLQVEPMLALDKRGLTVYYPICRYLR